MGRLNAELVEIKRMLDAATTLDAVGGVFRTAFAPWAKEKFTKERFEAGEIFAEVFSQLAEKEQPTALELYDFLNMSLQCDVEEYADNKKYKKLIAQGKRVKKEQIRDCLIDEGSKLLSSLFQEKSINPINDFRAGRIIFNANEMSKLVSGRIVACVYGIEFYITKEPLSGYLQKIGDRIEEELKDEYPSHANSIKNITTGKIWLRPKNKKERLLVKKICELKEKYFLEMEDVPEEFKKLINRNKESKEKLKREIEPRANIFFEELSKQSGISKEDATQWAKDNVYVAPNVAKKLDDLLYPVEQLRKDMAELYRYVGGKLGPVEFVVQRGNRRAWANGRAKICLSNDFTKRTLFHECGHLVEHWDDAVLQGSLAFIQGRATGAPKSLKDMTGCSYRPNEKAYPDKFIHPYVGKVYPWASSEVFSMGLQHLSSMEEMYKLADNDPEHFKLMLGQCLHKNPLLAHKAKEFMEETSARSKTNEDKKQKIDVFLKALDKAVKPIASALENMLINADETVPGYSLRVWPKESVLYWNISEGNYARLIGAPKKYALRAAYIHLLGHNGQLPISYNPLDQAITESIKDYALGIEVPEWFEPDKGLPTLDLGEEFAQNAKDMNESAANEVQRKKAFKKALKDAVPDWLEAELCDAQGIDGYEMLKTGTKASLYSEHYYAKFLFEDKKEICLMLAYLLICNYRNILPQSYGPDMRAKYNFIDFVKGKNVPDWFDENTKFPSLE